MNDYDMIEEVNKLSRLYQRGVILKPEFCVMLIQVASAELQRVLPPLVAAAEAVVAAADAVNSKTHV
jgi:hypothetical protein